MVAEASELYWMLLELGPWEQEGGALIDLKTSVTLWLEELSASKKVFTPNYLLELAEFVASRRWAVDQAVAAGDVGGMERMERAEEV